MSYCINPSCPQPKNPPQATTCRACHSKLLLRDRYRTTKILGKGGFGATFLAYDLALPGQPCCVIKQLRPSSQDPNVFQMAKELFEREAQTLGKLGNHPQIPRLLDYFEADQQFYLVQEYVSGHNLQQEVKKNGPFSEAGAKQFLSEMLPLLKYIHSLQVIHRDIKPANLIRREEDRKLVLIDFGAVKNQVKSTIVTDSTGGQTALTAFAVGTAGFAPPEQLSMRPVYASDVYAVGVTCIYLLTGKSPKDFGFDSATGDIAWRQHVNISDHLTKILQTMLEVSVRQRYKSADEALQALDLEPYFDSLSQGLVTKSGAKDAPQATASVEQPAKGPSATSKLAQAIRARKERQQQSGFYTMDTVAQRKPDSFILRSQVSSKDSRKRTVDKLDANAVSSSYDKGRRDFTGQNLRSLNLQEVNLAGCIFTKSNLSQINLQEADLSQANFGQANLSRAVLRKANLSRAYFGSTNLEDADLRGADLQFANFKQASLKGANLCGANLTNAQVTEEQLALAKTNWSTILPGGKRSFW